MINESALPFTIIHGQQPFPQEVTKSIFLLGPIPRTPITKYLSWKPEAYEILAELGFDGVVYDPEHPEMPVVTTASSNKEYERAPQVNWEVKAFNRADVVVAWIPRQFPEMLALSSNIEMGELFKSGKMLLGHPKGAPRMEYITHRTTKWLDDYYKWELKVHDTLHSLLSAAVARIGAGAKRIGGDVTVPLDIWRDKTFQQWRFDLALGRHELEGLTVEWVFNRRQHRDGRPKQRVWAIRPSVIISGENRRKDNEVAIGRPATVSVLMYYPDDNKSVLDWKIVLINEFRSAVMNHKGRVFELPGGSIESLVLPFDVKTIMTSAITEVMEEVGIPLDASRLLNAGVRQSMATLVACENHLYTYLLNSAEFEAIAVAMNKKEVYSNVGDNDEYTVPMFVRIGDLFSLNSLPIDWVNRGMIMGFVAEVLRHTGKFEV